MSDRPKWCEALDRFVAEMHALYGDRLVDVILYGSRARGDADADSDIDTLIVLKSLGDFWTELSHVGAVANRISLDYDVVLSAIPVSVGDFERPETPALIASRREGVHVG